MSPPFFCTLNMTLVYMKTFVKNKTSTERYLTICVFRFDGKKKKEFQYILEPFLICKMNRFQLGDLTEKAVAKALYFRSL